MKDIITDLDKLSDRCSEIDVKKDNALMREIIVELKETLREHKDGVGLAAPQIGYPYRIFVINFNGDLRTFINPTLILGPAKSFELSREGCLSLPEKQYLRPRSNEIVVMYQTPLGDLESKKMFGKAAIVFQHELDHLEGITLDDIGLEITKEFDEASEEEKEEVIKMYLDSLDIKQKELEKEINEDKDLKQISDAIKFMDALANNKVNIEQRPFTEEEMQQLKDKLNSENE